jgi:hypothetical protein
MSLRGRRSGRGNPSVSGAISSSSMRYFNIYLARVDNAERISTPYKLPDISRFFLRSTTFIAANSLVAVAAGAREAVQKDITLVVSTRSIDKISGDAYHWYLLVVMFQHDK